MIANTFAASQAVARQTTALAVPAFKAIHAPVHMPVDARRMFSRPFYNKVGLGIESSDSIDFFLKHRLSTAMDGTLKRIARDPGRYAELLEVFKQDFEKVHGHPIPPEHLANIDKCGMPWQIFRQARQDTLLKECNEPYVKYYREAMETAFARGGEVLFYLGGTFETQRYAEDIVRTEAREKMPFKDYIDQVPYATLAELDKPISTHAVMQKSYRPHPAVPGITNIEIYDLAVGSFRQHRDKVQYYSHDGARFDTSEFLARHDALLDAALTEENRKRVVDNEPMTAAARQAVTVFQQYLSGSGNVPVRGIPGVWRSE